MSYKRVHDEPPSRPLIDAACIRCAKYLRVSWVCYLGTGALRGQKAPAECLPSLIRSTSLFSLPRHRDVAAVAGRVVILWSASQYKRPYTMNDRVLTRALNTMLASCWFL